jgi:hypothetical protein
MRRSLGRTLKSKAKKGRKLLHPSPLRQNSMCGNAGENSKPDEFHGFNRNPSKLCRSNPNENMRSSKYRETVGESVRAFTAFRLPVLFLRRLTKNNSVIAIFLATHTLTIKSCLANAIF